MDDPPFWAAESVAAFLREQAAWRHAQAQRFPADRRNFRSASALEQLAAYVERLPATDLALNELIAVRAFEDDLRFIASDEARRAVTRYGFDYEPTPRTLLQDLVAITRRVRRAQTPAQKRKPEMIVATPPVPGSPGVLWFDDHSSHARHAASRPLGPDRVLTFCGKATDPRRATSEGAADWNTPEPACGVCAAAVERVAETSSGFVPTSNRATEAVHKYVDDIFTHAIYHDREVKRVESEIRDIVGPGTSGSELSESALGRVDDLVIEHKLKVADVCAILAPIALRRAAAIVEASGGRYDEGIINQIFDPFEANEYARGLFEAAGVGHRFVADRSIDESDKVVNVPSSLRRLYRFHFRLGGGPSTLAPGERALTANEQARVFEGQTEWEPIEIEGRRIGRSRYVAVAGGVVYGEAIVEPGEELPPALRVDHSKFAGRDGRKIFFDHAVIEARPTIDSIEEVGPNDS